MLGLLFLGISCKTGTEEANQVEKISGSDEMLIRISEIQIYQNYLTEYISILKEEAEASVRLEPGVISIFPMFQKEDSTEFRILEIYRNREAYESHLKTPHFKKYKTTTLDMVESLKLTDMVAIDEETMLDIFSKLNLEMAAQ
ncbi:quinol monooxygenase YgiN [Marinilabilia salmonicolor]|jgi:quinol monooxygenase YgiN|uniref:Quinol monooxygenase YgiN n=2 Tax=Marinilabilia salmonicolor TaxID=989 RepID=A0A368UQI2_9BACT|nr:quinol monooxygenase YgiN [Marinilabilia salmonicolor]